LFVNLIVKADTDDVEARARAAAIKAVFMTMEREDGMSGEWAEELVEWKWG
jgi:hypothetical protein